MIPKNEGTVDRANPDRQGGEMKKIIIGAAAVAIVLLGAFRRFGPGLARGAMRKREEMFGHAEGVSAKTDDAEHRGDPGAERTDPGSPRG